MKKHKKFIPITQAYHNALEREEEGKSNELSGMQTGSDNAALEGVS